MGILVMPEFMPLLASSESLSAHLLGIAAFHLLRATNQVPTQALTRLARLHETPTQECRENVWLKERSGAMQQRG